MTRVAAADEVRALLDFECKHSSRLRVGPMIEPVGSHAAGSDPGEFAAKRFGARRRACWRRVWWLFRLFAAFLVAISVRLGLLLQPENVSFFSGLGAGLALAATIALADSPPHHIERWRQGAEGEKATAKALRPLVRAGWTLVNDIDTRRGNFDHVLVGPPGVFLLESKNLHGLLSVRAGTLSVRWREDPDDGYESFRLAHRMRFRAGELEQQLRRTGAAGCRSVGRIRAGLDPEQARCLGARQGDSARA